MCSKVCVFYAVVHIVLLLVISGKGCLTSDYIMIEIQMKSKGSDAIEYKADVNDAGWMFAVCRFMPPCILLDEVFVFLLLYMFLLSV